MILAIPRSTVGLAHVSAVARVALRQAGTCWGLTYLRTSHRDHNPSAPSPKASERYWMPLTSEAISSVCLGYTQI